MLCVSSTDVVKVICKDGVFCHIVRRRLVLVVVTYSIDTRCGDKAGVGHYGVMSEVTLVLTRW